MTETPAESALTVEVVWARAGRAWRVRLTLPAGTTVGTAMQAWMQVARDWPEEAAQPAGWAVFGREVSPETVLRDGDRLELLRALPSDPKLARRARAEGSTQKGPKRG